MTTPMKVVIAEMRTFKILCFWANEFVFKTIRSICIFLYKQIIRYANGVLSRIHTNDVSVQSNVIETSGMWTVCVRYVTGIFAILSRKMIWKGTKEMINTILFLFIIFVLKRTFIENSFFLVESHLFFSENTMFSNKPVFYWFSHKFHIASVNKINKTVQHYWCESEFRETKNYMKTVCYRFYIMFVQIS